MTPIRLALPAVMATAFLAMPAFAAEPLALKRVLLSTGGVGYFEYEAKVTGNETLDLAVPLDQVDDVMKSIVVYDDKGGIGEISLPGREPLAAAFREMPFGPEALSSPADLLNALRGAEVRVDGARAVSGRILSVVAETSKDKDGAQITRHRVSLMTAGGVRQFLLEEADGLQFADPALQAKLDAALAALARDSAKDRRTLAIRTTGDGERTLRVGYVVEAPLWKTSYRLTLAADPKADKAGLQGWAVLENMSGADWDGVDLTVISGNPVTFRQALYQSYTVARPDVPVEVAGRVLPPVDERARDADAEGRARMGAGAPPPPAPRALMMAAPAAEAVVADQFDGAPQQLAKVTAAESGETATQVSFHLPEPVTVAAGHSLLVPIVDREIPASRVDLYLPDTEPKHPLAAVDLKNDGQTGLPPGVLTLYERGADGAVAYVGDARLGALPTGETRLLSFAVDQKVTVDREDKQDSTLARARIVDGVMELTTTQSASVTYAVTGAAGEDRTVLLQTPRYEGWTLTAPDKAKVEIVSGQYRIRQAVPAGKTVTVTVTQEQPVSQSVDLADDADDQIAAWAEDRTLPAKLRQAMADLAGQLGAIRDREAEAQRLEQRQTEIGQEQARLRENLGAVPKDSDLFQRYLAKLNDSESELEQVGTGLDKLRKAIDAARAQFRQSVRKLNV
ncbi:DUF4139 domain-containing protein [Inquilinus limosus]|uniref:DUF4139 domain-containing protein n=1 Tax=Inquilinus limosus MP06 TaxID=1398085 RepID=A0A0A0D1V6_9PROT|nr:DUF4139 domain-containing protein [Inquilinus limosus]KGM31037.1 hypothetical protein P409_29545 [Inquilinus limosus MP06]